MFNQFGRARPNPINPYGSPGSRQRPQLSQPAQSQGQQDSHGAEYKPDFLHPLSTARPSTEQAAPSRMQRIKPDTFGSLAPQDQRAALFDQARQQMSQSSRLGYQLLRDPSSMLPGGLTERQRSDFKMLQRTDPAAAQKQLLQYQRTSDIRYNKPLSGGSQPPAGPTYHRPPANFNGPRPRFGN